METEAFRIKALYETALRDGQCHQWLSGLTTTIGHRISGSENAERAIAYCKNILDTLHLDSVWTQPCTVTKWVRGDREIVQMETGHGQSIRLRALALGNSIGTGPSGISAEVIEVHDLDSLRAMREELIRGKIVFFNRPMDETLINTFQAYGRAVDQRWAGPAVAADKGAIAAIVRSMTTSIDTVPHTGSTQYRPNENNIPSVAISTVDAEMLGSQLRKGRVNITIRTTCEMQDSVQSYNVIGQINGSGADDGIILVGGHLDSWDVGQGAHDDGAGCVQAMDVLYLLRESGFKPRHTIRCVLFMNEENGTGGAREYARVSNGLDEFHLAAIESDAGGFLPLGFGCSAEGVLQEQYLKSVNGFWNLLEPYQLALSPGGGGSDIGPLKSQGGMLFGMRVDSQRYFDYHHTNEDTIDKVNPRELKLGAAAMAALVSLIDSHTTRIHG